MVILPNLPHGVPFILSELQEKPYLMGVKRFGDFADGQEDEVKAFYKDMSEIFVNPSIPKLCNFNITLLLLS